MPKIVHFDEFFHGIFKTHQITNGNLIVAVLLVESNTMQHLCSPHKWPMEIGHHKWPLKAIVVPNAKHEGYNEALGGHEWWPIHWSRVRTTQIPLCSFLTTKSQFAVKIQNKVHHSISRFFFEMVFQKWVKKFVKWQLHNYQWNLSSLFYFTNFLIYIGKKD